MNNILQFTNISRTTPPPRGKMYGAAGEWYVALAEMHIAQLVFQHNDLVTTADDCRNKYVARRLFYKLAEQGWLSTFVFLENDWSAQSKSQTSTLSPAPSGSSSFKLWCVNEADDIIAVID